jgi:hypothetical protein
MHSVPVLFWIWMQCTSEGGAAACPFTEVKALYGDQMNSVFSGGVAYEYSEADQKGQDADCVIYSLFLSNGLFCIC